MATNSNHLVHRHISRLLPSILLSGLFLTALTLSWRAWPDILVDFGRELYLPWRVSQGQVLYQDQAHLFGPISVYYHAALFRVFGPSYTVIILSNLGVFVILLYLLYSLWCRLSRLAAWTTIAVTTAIFGFGQYVGIGNYNFLSPYSHETTHGLLLAALMIHQLGEYTGKTRRRHLVLAGFVFGLVLLTRTDIILATLAVAVVFFILTLLIQGKKFVSRDTVIFIAAACIPVVIFAVYLATRIPVREVGPVLLEPWRILTIDRVRHNAFYDTVTGLNQPVRNLAISIVETMGIVIFMVLLMWVARLSIEHPKWGRLGKTAWLAGASIAILMLTPYDIGRSLPVLCTVSLITLLRKRPFSDGSTTKLMLWGIFSLALLFRMPLHATFVHYGFYLALPATNFLVGSMVWDVPFWLERSSPHSKKVVRDLMLAAVFILASTFFAFSNNIYRMKNFKIGNGADQFWALDPKFDPRTAVTTKTLNWLENNLHNDETFVAMPEGIMLNYLTRHTNPTRFINFMPPELAAYGETTIIDELNSHSPDYVLIVHKDTSEYGYEFYGKNSAYGMSIMNWINQHYHLICLFGNQPLTNENFGIEIRIRNNYPADSIPRCMIE